MRASPNSRPCLSPCKLRKRSPRTTHLAMLSLLHHPLSRQSNKWPTYSTTRTRRWPNSLPSVLTLTTTPTLLKHPQRDPQALPTLPSVHKRKMTLKFPSIGLCLQVTSMAMMNLPTTKTSWAEMNHSLTPPSTSAADSLSARKTSKLSKSKEPLIASVTGRP